MVSLNEVRNNPEQWIDTSYLRSDGKLEYREKKEYGNRHVVFDDGVFLGSVHIDQHNATDFPIGTVKHFSNYVEEKTHIPHVIVDIVIAGITAYAGYKTAKWAYNNIKDSV